MASKQATKSGTLKKASLSLQEYHTYTFLIALEIKNFQLSRSVRWFSDFPMIHSAPELPKCRSEPDKPRALTQCTHTHTHSHTLSLTGQEGSARDIQEFLISATRANAGALCLKRNDKWGAIGMNHWTCCIYKKKRVSDESKRSPFYRMWPLPHSWIKAKVRFHYLRNPRYAQVLNPVWLPFL